MMRAALKSFAALALLAGVSPSIAAVQTLTTAEHPNLSAVTLELFLGDPNDSGSTLLATLGPVGVTGSAVTAINLDPSDSGTLSVASSSLNLANFGPQTINLLGLGTVDTSLLGVGFEITGGPIAVANNNFTISASTPGQISINAGSVSLANPTGLIAVLLPTGTSLNFGTDPITLDFSQLGTSTLTGTVDDDAGLQDSDGSEVNIQLGAALPLTTLGTLPVFARLTGSVSLGSPPGVPEVGTLLMMSFTLAAAAGVAGVRRMVKR